MVGGSGSDKLWGGYDYSTDELWGDYDGAFGSYLGNDTFYKNRYGLQGLFDQIKDETNGDTINNWSWFWSPF